MYHSPIKLITRSDDRTATQVRTCSGTPPDILRDQEYDTRGVLVLVLSPDPGATSSSLFGRCLSTLDFLGLLGIYCVHWHPSEACSELVQLIEHKMRQACLAVSPPR